MTRLITLSLRFLLILVQERARRLSWVVAQNPADWAIESGNALSSGIIGDMNELLGLLPEMMKHEMTSR